MLFRSYVIMFLIAPAQPLFGFTMMGLCAIAPVLIGPNPTREIGRASCRERVHAFINTADAVITVEAVRAHCAANLADYKVPETVSFVTTPLPRNPNGKLMKRLLRDIIEKSS